MNKVRLVDCCEFILDGTHGSPVRTPSGVPVLSAQNVIDGRLSFATDRFTSVSEYDSFKRRLNVQPSDVLLTIVGTIGRVAIVTEQKPLVFQRSVAVLRPKQQAVLPRFLFRALQQDSVKAQLARSTNQSSQAGIYLGKLKQVEITLPPLDEQRRIAALLDKAEALLDKRRQAISKLDSLLQSVFLDMFGDPVTNPKRWDILPLKQMCDVRDGTHDSPRYVQEGYPLITSKNLAKGYVDLSEVNFISESDFTQINKRSKVDDGDILMPMIGTVGNPVLVDHIPNYAIKNVALIKFLPHSPSNVYLLHLLSGHYFDYVSSRNNRGGTQKFISLGDIRNLPIVLPPPELQHSFEEIVSKIMNAKARQLDSLRVAENLFKTLQQQAFNGNLFNERPPSTN